MPLVKDGKISGDEFVHLADDAEIPGDGAILVSAARFLADPETLAGRSARTGVIWPNNRDLDDLVPYLDRLCCGNVTSIEASCARPARCCATSSCS